MPTTVESHQRLREITEKIIGKPAMNLLDKMGTDVRWAHEEDVCDLLPTSDGFGYSDQANIIFYPPPVHLDKNRVEQQLFHEMGHAYDFVVMKRNFEASSEGQYSTVEEIDAEVRAWIYAEVFHTAFGVKDWDLMFVKECLATYLNAYMRDITKTEEDFLRECSATTRRYLRRLKNHE